MTAAELTARDPGAWPAPSARGPVNAVVRLPGSKSMTARALVIAALAGSPSVIVGGLRSRDTDLMAAGLRALGVAIDLTDDAAWSVTPGPLHAQGGVNVGLAGTVMRFLPGVAALARGSTIFDGDPRARQRPVGALTAALRTVGATIDGDGLPLTVHGHGALPGGEVVIDSSASSQFLSALLLVGASTQHGIVVRHCGPPMPSLPHVRMTVAMLREAGALVDDTQPDRWEVTAGALHGSVIAVQLDLSNAAPFLAAALVTGGTVRVPGWPTATTQAGDALRGLLAGMGASVERDPEGLTVRGTGEITGIDADLHDVGELTPVLTALAALASSPSHLHGIAHLRGHETDRLAALAEEINHLGGRVTQTEDSLSIRPVPLHGGLVHSHDDHRIATAAAVLGLRIPGLHVDDVATTAKTMPTFVEAWTAMLAH